MTVTIVPKIGDIIRVMTPKTIIIQTKQQMVSSSYRELVVWLIKGQPKYYSLSGFLHTQGSILFAKTPPYNVAFPSSLTSLSQQTHI